MRYVSYLIQCDINDENRIQYSKSGLKLEFTQFTLQFYFHWLALMETKHQIVLCNIVPFKQIDSGWMNETYDINLTTLSSSSDDIW